MQNGIPNFVLGQAQRFILCTEESELIATKTTALIIRTSLCEWMVFAVVCLLLEMSEDGRSFDTKD